LPDEPQAAVGEVAVEGGLHRRSVAAEDLAPHTAREIEVDVRGADEDVCGMVEDVALLDFDAH
jgi:hypothetical protein